MQHHALICASKAESCPKSGSSKLYFLGLERSFSSTLTTAYL